MKTKPRLSFWQIWNMSFGFLGIQFGFALQNANVSRIFQTLGAKVDEIAILWVAAPMTGLIIQPIIGYLSDRTWHPKWGRRRPFFFIGALMASIALLIMPNSSFLWFAAAMLWIMDASINISMEPFRAFVGDNLPNEQRTLGFAMQSFFIGAGAFIASWLPKLFDYYGVQNVGEVNEIPDTVKFSFYVGGIVYLLSVIWTVFKSKEYSPDELKEYEKNKSIEKKEEHSENWHFSNGKKHVIYGATAMITGLLLTWLIYFHALKKDLYVLSLGMITFFGFLFVLSGIFQMKKMYKNGYINIMNDFQTMPKTMKQLALVQFFSWFALFSFWIYATPAITDHIYRSQDTTSVAYNSGANIVSGMMGNYNLIAALVAFLLPIFAKFTTRKFAHFTALVLGGLGLISIFFMKEGILLQWLPMIGLGIAWASILSVPYAILSASLPVSKMGYYMGVFNFFIVIPQLVAASLLGFILSGFFDNKPIFAMIIGGISMIIAGLMTLLVNDRRQNATQ